MSPKIAIRIVLRSMGRNAITVYGFVFGATFWTRICTEKTMLPDLMPNLESFDTAFQWNFVDYKPADVASQMAVENGFKKFVYFTFFPLHLDFDPAVNQVSSSIRPRRTRS